MTTATEVCADLTPKQKLIEILRALLSHDLKLILRGQLNALALPPECVPPGVGVDEAFDFFVWTCYAGDGCPRPAWVPDSFEVVPNSRIQAAARRAIDVAKRYEKPSDFSGPSSSSADSMLAEMMFGMLMRGVRGR